MACGNGLVRTPVTNLFWLERDDLCFALCRTLCNTLFYVIRGCGWGRGLVYFCRRTM